MVTSEDHEDRTQAGLQHCLAVSNVLDTLLSRAQHLLCILLGLDSDVSLITETALTCAPNPHMQAMYHCHQLFRAASFVACMTTRLWPLGCILMSTEIPLTYGYSLNSVSLHSCVELHLLSKCRSCVKLKPTDYSHGGLEPFVPAGCLQGLRVRFGPVDKDPKLTCPGCLEPYAGLVMWVGHVADVVGHRAASIRTASSSSKFTLSQNS